MALKGVALPDDGIMPRMVQTLDHRGPDATGWCRRDRCLLGNARLSIIDLESGDQPMDIGDRYTIVYNGEIYNYREVRERLKQKGSVFHTRSDTEVILQGYAARGAGILDELNGMFAFAIWDSHRSTLFLARDHLGIKPLYYSLSAGFLVFGSEIKTILSSGMVPKKVNKNAIFHHLCRQEPLHLETMFEGVRELEPGTWMKLSASGGLETGSYFELEDEWRKIDGLPRTETEMVAEGEERIRLSVQHQLVSDVPVGVSLSGGMDSALIYRYMIEGYPGTLHAFTYANADPEVNELGKAEQVIRSLDGKVRHHVEHVRLPDYLGLFEEACALYDGPVTYPSSIPILMLSRLASRAGIKVLMSGQGGDELFMGYVRYRRWIEQGLIEEPDLNTWAEHLYFGGGLDKVDRVEALTGESRDVARESSVYQWIFHHQDLPPLKRMALFDQKFRLMYLLKRDDRMGMGGNVEIRVPFLDKDLVSWANALDDKWKINGRSLKYALKEVGKSALPEVITASPKMGSPVDFESWIGTRQFVGALRELVEAEDSFSRDYLCFDEVRRLVVDHGQGFEFGHLAWCLFSLEHWYRACFHDSAYPGATAA